MRILYCIKVRMNLIFLAFQLYLVVNRKNTTGMMCELSGSQCHIVWSCNYILISCWIHTSHKPKNNRSLIKRIYLKSLCCISIFITEKWNRLTIYLLCFHLVTFIFIPLMSKKEKNYILSFVKNTFQFSEFLIYVYMFLVHISF